MCAACVLRVCFMRAAHVLRDVLARRGSDGVQTDRQSAFGHVSWKETTLTSTVGVGNPAPPGCKQSSEYVRTSVRPPSLPIV